MESSHLNTLFEPTAFEIPRQDNSVMKTLIAFDLFAVIASFSDSLLSRDYFLYEIARFSSVLSTAVLQ